MLIRTILLLIAVTLTGCASNPMQVASKQVVAKPQADEAQVTFMRSSFVGSLISASLYDVTDGEIKFIGILNNETKVSYTTPPGKRIFMVVSEAADFMEADLTPGKNYYSIATPRMGAWKARFSLWPIKNSSHADYQLESKDYKSWMKSTKLMMNSDKAISWYENNKASVQKKYNKYWPAWNTKSKADILKRTLLPSDGV